MIWSQENFQGLSFRCDGQCTIKNISGTVGNDRAKSGKVENKQIIIFKKYDIETVSTKPVDQRNVFAQMMNLSSEIFSDCHLRSHHQKFRRRWNNNQRQFMILIRMQQYHQIHHI